MKFTTAYLMLLCCFSIDSAGAAEDWLVIPTATPTAEHDAKPVIPQNP